jgi:PPK2 family polyphosphate:nucleotide phosphotransferase
MSLIKLSAINTKAAKSIQKNKIKAETKKILKKLDELQNLLFAENKHSILVVLQGMDASGKDGAIRNVFGHLNPQGVKVKSYKAPSTEELSHDFLWRIHKEVPSKGIIQIFNRSHYEDILITRVHKWCDDKTALTRIKAINDFEELISKHNNTKILKFYLHISKSEQTERLNERIHDKRKQWKYNEKDFEEAKLWNEYMNAYEDCFNKCNKIPWNIIPSDQNWYKEFLIAKKLLETLVACNMQYPGIKK